MALKERHGRGLCFAGGVSVQRTLPFGSAAEVRAEVEQRIDVLGRDGGYVLPSTRNIAAIDSTAKKGRRNWNGRK